MSVTFKLKADPAFDAPVPIPIPGGEPRLVKFTFRHRTRDEFDAFLEASTQMGNVEFVLAVAVGWELTDPFNSDNVALLLQNYHGAAAAISVAYTRELRGARLGN